MIFLTAIWLPHDQLRVTVEDTSSTNLIIITLRVNMITRHITPFFSSAVYALPVNMIHFFYISRPFKLSLMGSLFRSVKYTFIGKR